ncbi:hypothetical protein FS837_003889, partial [Tulasnella sp. UAMH 9824]
LLDLESDVQREIITAGVLTSTPDTTSRDESLTRDTQDLGEVGAQDCDKVLVEDHHRTDSVVYGDYSWKWTNREGTLPKGGRRTHRPDLPPTPPVGAIPTLSPPVVTWNNAEDDLDDEGFRKGDLEKAILMSLGFPIDAEPLSGAGPTPTGVDGRLSNVIPAMPTSPTPPPVTLLEAENEEVEGHEFSRA